MNKKRGIYRIVTAWVILMLFAIPTFGKKRPHVPDSLQVITVEVKGIPIHMRRVEGGSFTMGGTIEQTDRDVYTDKPAHLVFLSPYYIAETEVTNQLWAAVMPERESLSPKGYPQHPISYVTWTDCQEFVRRLDSLTGRPFRLPTEAEWEYAARGGAKSKKHRFAGGDEPDSVGWTNHCSGNWTHPVARKHPNELGLYDMTGNVNEWCEDWYAPYNLGTEPNPCVRDSSEGRIARGGSYDDCIANSHLSIRRWYTPETSRGYIGFRVAFTLPDDPMMQVEVEQELPLTKKVKVNGKKLEFRLVPVEEPYYISEEISVQLWKKLMRKDPPSKIKSVATGMRPSDRMIFAERCSRESNERMTVASAEEIVTAVQQGLITTSKAEVKERDKGKSVQQLQKKRKSRKKLTLLTELVGVKLTQPDDPVLLQYKKENDEVRPLRLVIHPIQQK